jgi:hypothetical protein
VQNFVGELDASAESSFTPSCQKTYIPAPSLQLGHCAEQDETRHRRNQGDMSSMQLRKISEESLGTAI